MGKLVSWYDSSNQIPRVWLGGLTSLTTCLAIFTDSLFKRNIMGYVFDNLSDIICMEN